MTRIEAIAAFVRGFAEATLFFIVPDMLLSAIALKRGARAAVRASVLAACGAGVGGALMYLWSAHDAEGAFAAVLAVPAISETMAVQARAAMADNWFTATLAGPLSQTPFKLYAILAPEAGAGLGAFALAGAVARLPRFLIVSLGVALLGRILGRRFSPTALLWTCGGAWILFYIAFFSLTPG